MTARSAVVNAQRRFRARRRRVPGWLAIAVAAVVAIVVSAWLALHSSLFDVREVTVEGTSRLTTDQVLSAARVQGGGSLLAIDSAAIEARVARLRPVASVSVTRRWPHGVVIQVHERRPAAVVTGTGQPMLLDADGVAFAPADETADGLVDVRVDAPVPGAGDRQARAAMAVLGALPTKLRARVERLDAAATTDVRLQLRDGRTVLWGSPADSATKVAVLRSLLPRRAHVYDVSTPDVVVTR